MRTRRPPAPAARPARPSALRPGGRPGGGIRRTRTVRRRSAGVTPARAGALLALLVALGGLYGAMSSEAFRIRGTTIEGNAWTSDATILAALAIAPDQNAFTLGTSSLERALDGIPAIRDAHVTVALPGSVRVTVAEREALLVWRVGERRFLVDGEGLLFGELPAAPSAAARAVPVITDTRAGSRTLDVGSTLDGVSLDAATRLGSIRPADVGSRATGLTVAVSDTSGWVLRRVPTGWAAVFGFYTPTLRTPDLVPGQVRLLRSLLGQHDEARVERIILADDRSGTWVPLATPRASASPKP